MKNYSFVILVRQSSVNHRMFKHVVFFYFLFFNTKANAVQNSIRWNIPNVGYQNTLSIICSGLVNILFRNVMYRRPCKHDIVSASASASSTYERVWKKLYWIVCDIGYLNIFFFFTFCVLEMFIFCRNEMKYLQRRAVSALNLYYLPISSPNSYHLRLRPIFSVLLGVDIVAT